MNLFPRFTNRRRVLQLGWYSLRHGTRLFDKLNGTNVFLAKAFRDFSISCNVCGRTAKVWYEMHSVREKREHRVSLLRETLECLNCMSRMRYRIMAYGILTECSARFGISATSLSELAPKIQHLDILDTDAFSPVAGVLRANTNYRMSSYIANRPFGQVAGQLYNVDLQSMPFADASFDIILSSDVMEHVRDFARANREIIRCLKPGGAHIFTVPFEDPSKTTRQLIDSAGPVDIYLELPQLHGDDNLAGRVPAYRIYGWDLLDDLRALGFEASAIHVKDAHTGIFDERYFVARRPGALS